MQNAPRAIVAPLTAALALAASVANAQTVAIDPAAPPPRPIPAATSRAWGPPPQIFASMRFTLGAVVPESPQPGAAFTLGVTAGTRVGLPLGGNRAWVLGPDLGFERTWGLGERDMALASAGFCSGFAWGLFGVAWAPRALYGLRDGGDTVWGVRNGLRLLIVGGLLDVEVAHQYVTGDRGDAHQVLFTVGMDPGLALHVLTQVGRHPRR